MSLQRQHFLPSYLETLSVGEKTFSFYKQFPFLLTRKRFESKRYLELACKDIVSRGFSLEVTNRFFRVFLCFVVFFVGEGGVERTHYIDYNTNNYVSYATLYHRMPSIRLLVLSY